jgi:hypothetical protein
MSHQMPFGSAPNGTAELPSCHCAVTAKRLRCLSCPMNRGAGSMIGSQQGIIWAHAMPMGLAMQPS